MTSPPTKRFIILIGGPTVFMRCDKEHDQTWSNYIVPMQIAAQRVFITGSAMKPSIGWSTSCPISDAGRMIL